MPIIFAARMNGDLGPIDGTGGIATVSVTSTSGFLRNSLARARASMVLATGNKYGPARRLPGASESGFFSWWRAQGRLAPAFLLLGNQPESRIGKHGAVSLPPEGVVCPKQAQGCVRAGFEFAVGANSIEAIQSKACLLVLVIFVVIFNRALSASS